jgi:hypothetical protein
MKTTPGLELRRQDGNTDTSSGDVRPHISLGRLGSRRRNFVRLFIGSQSTTGGRRHIECNVFILRLLAGIVH